MNLARLKTIIKESIIEDQRSMIDSFISEFKGFNLEEAERELEHKLAKLEFYKRRANSNLFETDNTHTIEYYSKRNECIKLNQKIQKYITEKDNIDCLVHNHKDYVFKKHGKIV